MKKVNQKLLISLALVSMWLGPVQAISWEPQQLSKVEKDGLLHMVEEEKLAHDVYTRFAEKWGSRPFGNIVRAEKSHIESVQVLLAKYEIKDPTKGNSAGKFVNKDLQSLYDKLIERGQESRISALIVGAKIEELDIADLDRMIKQTERKDILLVYRQLRKGSENHLRAFVRVLKREGKEYVPEHISQSEFMRIVSGG